NFYDFVKQHPGLMKQFSSRDLLFLRIDCGPDFTKETDWAHHHCVLHVLSGRKKISSQELVMELDQGNTVFIKKGGLVLERLSDGSCVLVFYIPDQYIRAFVKEHRALFEGLARNEICREQFLPIQQTPVIDAYYASVIPYFTAEGRMPENLVELKFRELMLNIVSNPSNPKLACYMYRVAQSSSSDIEEIMENNYLFNLRLPDYARLCHRSLSSYKRDFIQAFGCPPGKWLLERRVNHASKLIRDTARPIQDIVQESGFANHAHFDRVFRKYFGCAPLQYRRQAEAVA
ncbi:MAG TPA: AraC family transcriptional regulator, partial [Flavisolibacter sp.]